MVRPDRVDEVDDPVRPDDRYPPAANSTAFAAHQPLFHVDGGWSGSSFVGDEMSSQSWAVGWSGELLWMRWNEIS